MEEGRSELVIKYLQGQLDTQGINDFYTWVNENVENKKVFFEIKRSMMPAIPIECRMIWKEVGIAF